MTIVFFTKEGEIKRETIAMDVTIKRKPPRTLIILSITSIFPFFPENIVRNDEMMIFVMMEDVKLI